LKVCDEPSATWKYKPAAWSSSELKRVVRLPSRALAGTSPPLASVLELATQFVRDRTLSPEVLAEQLAPLPVVVVVVVVVLVVVEVLEVVVVPPEPL
jgi:hypothetical protein